MQPTSRQWWHPVDLALCGGVAGMALSILCQAYELWSGAFEDADPFVHAVMEMAVFACGGALLFAAAARILNRVGRSRWRREPH
jgi:hypothetical protein